MTAPTRVGIGKWLGKAHQHCVVGIHSHRKGVGAPCRDQLDKMYSMRRPIIRAAEAAGRDLTATEQSEFDRLLDRAADRKSAADTQREVDHFSRELGPARKP